jgi:hypothetical protein
VPVVLYEGNANKNNDLRCIGELSIRVVGRRLRVVTRNYDSSHLEDSGLRAPSAGASIEERTFNRLFAQYGPVVAVNEAWKLLSFRSKDAFNRAVQKGRLPLRVIRPAGRRESFLATKDVAAYLATLATPANEEVTPM